MRTAECIKVNTFYDFNDVKEIIARGFGAPDEFLQWEAVRASYNGCHRKFGALAV